MDNTTISSRLKYKTLEDLNRIKNAITTLQAYSIELEGLDLTQTMVLREIQIKRNDVWCDCGCTERG